MTTAVSVRSRWSAGCRSAWPPSRCSTHRRARAGREPDRDGCVCRCRSGAAAIARQTILLAKTADEKTGNDDHDGEQRRRGLARANESSRKHREGSGNLQQRRNDHHGQEEGDRPPIDRSPTRLPVSSGRLDDECDRPDEGDAGAIEPQGGQTAECHPRVHEDENDADDWIQLVAPALEIGARRRRLRHPFDGLGNEHLVVAQAATARWVASDRRSSSARRDRRSRLRRRSTDSWSIPGTPRRDTRRCSSSSCPCRRRRCEACLRASCPSPFSQSRRRMCDKS